LLHLLADGHVSGWQSAFQSATIACPTFTATLQERFLLDFMLLTGTLGWDGSRIMQYKQR
jgi:hypothetical protein